MLPVPLDAKFHRYVSHALVLPADPVERERLLGVRGRLRCAPGLSDLGVDSDLEAVGLWLSSKTLHRSADTVDAYRREAERLLTWLYTQHGVALSDMTTQDFDAYTAFLKDPQPRARWVQSADKPDARRGQDGWGFFKGPMKPSNVTYVFTILNGMLNWLAAHGHLVRNPIAADAERRQNKAKNSKDRRALSAVAVAACFSTIDRLPCGSERAQREKARARYLFSLMYGMGLRIGDIAHPHNSMADFVQLEAGSTVSWFWTGLSKGYSPESQLPPPLPCGGVIAELAAYRRSLKIEPELPAPNDPHPGMVLSLSGRKRIGEGSIYRIIRDLFKTTARHEADQPNSALTETDIRVLAQASPHTLRHTNITRRLSEGVPLQTVQQLARHKDPKTTTGYNSDELETLSAAGTLTLPESGVA